MKQLNAIESLSHKARCTLNYNKMKLYPPNQLLFYAIVSFQCYICVIITCLPIMDLFLTFFSLSSLQLWWKKGCEKYVFSVEIYLIF